MPSDLLLSRLPGERPEVEQGEDRTLIKRLLDLLERHQIDVPGAWLPSWLRRSPTTPPTLD